MKAGISIYHCCSHTTQNGVWQRKGSEWIFLITKLIIYLYSLKNAFEPPPCAMHCSGGLNMTVNKVDKDTVLETLSIYRSFYLSLAVLVFIYLHLYVNLYLYMSVYLSNIGKCIVMGLWVIFHVCALLYFLSFLNCWVIAVVIRNNCVDRKEEWRNSSMQRKNLNIHPVPFRHLMPSCGQ